jgi:hypothetical protein
MQNRGDGYNLTRVKKREIFFRITHCRTFFAVTLLVIPAVSMCFFYGLSLRGKDLLRLRYREGASSEEFTIEASIE